MIKLVIICLYLGYVQSSDDTPLYMQIPDMIQHLCPGSDVCSSNRSSETLDNISFQHGTESCCAECSCSSGCTETGNCCYRNTIPFNYTLDRHHDYFSNVRSCLFPMIPQPETDKHIYESYHMVTSTASSKSLTGGREVSSNSTCGEMNIASWGSLYPVYSAKSKQIYKNIECAKEDGMEEDVIRWDVVMKCKTTEITQSANTLAADIEQFSDYDSCQIHFIFPGSYDILKPLKCYINLVDTCSESYDFQVPDGINVSKDDIRKLCTKSGILSPYRYRKMYANVFCHICNEKYFFRNTFCIKYDEASALESKGGFSKGFLALIDGDLMTDTKDTVRVKKQDVPTACSISDVLSCRQILCPTGRWRDGKNRCVYPYKIWYDQIYAVYINLTLDQFINISDAFNVAYGKSYTTILPALESAWLKRWLIYSIYYRVQDDAHMSDNVIITVYKILPRVKPDIFIANIEKMIGRAWSMRLGNVTEVLKSENFSVGWSFSYTKERNKAKKFINLTNDIAIPYVYYKLAYASNVPIFNKHIITSLYFCDQIELKASEFLLNKDLGVLYIYNSKRVLFRDRFVLINSKTFSETRARICIEDSGLYEKVRNAMSRNFQLGFIIVTLLLLFL